ncbi:DNA cytosine methyltransferase [Kutzneria albida]
MAVRSALGGDLAWYSEIDPAASKLLAHHHPGVPNLGDITAIDWDQVEPVDILAGGFPCQDVSSAGLRAGLAEGTRSGLWLHMATAIRTLRPRLVVVENVRGILSAKAHCDLEPCPWCLGDSDVVPLRALGCVLGDLATLGYDAVWCGLRAAEVGAPHNRYRVFVAAADTAGDGRDEGWPESARLVGGLDAALGGAAVQNTNCATGGEWRFAAPGQAQGGWAWAHIGRRGGTSTADADQCERCGHPEWQYDEGGFCTACPTDRQCYWGEAAADTNGGGQSWNTECDSAQVREEGQHQPRLDTDRRVLDWGAYEPAIRRWESVLGRPAPEPTEPGRRANRVLSPRFVEWLMGLPAGHVTGVEGVSRNDQLKLLGNGVVPQQGEAALRHLLPLLSTAGRCAA